MKPFDLEGKVGAPAIVRTNPLLRVYDELYAPGRDEWSTDELPYERALRTGGPYRWADLLAMVQERYEGSGTDRFFTTASRYVEDRVLRYDLDTPSMELVFDVRWDHRPRAVLFEGSCSALDVRHSSMSVIARGDVFVFYPDFNVAVIEAGTVRKLALGGAFCLLDIRPADPPILESSSDGSFLLTTTPLQYVGSFCHGAICSPDEDPAFRSLADDVRALASDPERLLKYRSRIYARAYALRSKAHDIMAARNDPRAPSRVHRAFTPRGASR